ncbi:unnamed protein product [Chrysoparadoxa australica]
MVVPEAAVIMRKSSDAADTAEDVVSYALPQFGRVPQLVSMVKRVTLALMLLPLGLVMIRLVTTYLMIFAMGRSGSELRGEVAEMDHMTVDDLAKEATFCLSRIEKMQQQQEASREELLMMQSTFGELKGRAGSLIGILQGMEEEGSVAEAEAQEAQASLRSAFEAVKEGFAQVEEDLAYRRNELAAQIQGFSEGAATPEMPDSFVAAADEMGRALEEQEGRLQRLGDEADGLEQRLETELAFAEDVKEEESESSSMSPADVKAEVYRTAQELKEDIQVVYTQGRQSASGCLGQDQAQGLIEHAVEVFAADKTGQRDYASRAEGARVVQPTSPTYTAPGHRLSTDHYQKLHLESGVGGPLEAISRDTSLNACWAMAGDEGELTVKLAAPVTLGAVAIEHISRLVALDATSAPRAFEVWSLGELLLSGVYDVLGPPVQTFTLPQGSEQHEVDTVTFKVLSNHGNPSYTCIYRLRVFAARESL